MIPDADWKNNQMPWKIEWVGRSVSTNAKPARLDDDDDASGDKGPSRDINHDVFQHSRKAHKIILIFRRTFGNPYSRAKTNYYQLSPIRYFLPQNQLNMVKKILCIWDLVASYIFVWPINLFTFTKPFGKR